MNVQCENCSAHFQISPGDMSGATACPDCGGTRFLRDQPSPTRSDGTLRNMVDSDSQKDQGGNPLGEGTIMGSDGEKPIWKRDNYMHSNLASNDVWALEDNIVKTIAAHPGITIPQIAQQLDIRLNQLYRILPLLSQEGKIARPSSDPRGWYTTRDLPPNTEVLNRPPVPATAPMNTPEHPDPWMDNEPGSMTFPTEWTAKVSTYTPMDIVAALVTSTPDEEGYNGWTNWDTWHTKLMMDNEHRLYEAQQKMAEEGWTPEQIRDWAIQHVIGPHNQQQIADAQEWNSIPQEERLDPHYEELKAKNPQAAELVDSLGMGADTSDTQPSLMDPELVNWHEIHHNINNDYQENQAYERGEDPVERSRRLKTEEQQGMDAPGEMTIPQEWTSKTAGEMEDILGLTPSSPPPRNFMAWQPGMQGRGLVIGNEPHTWSVYHPDMVGDESHSGYVKKLGIDPKLVNWDSQVEIHPSGEVEALAGRDPMPYINADPRLKPLKEENGDIFSVQPTMQSTTTASASRTLNMDPYMPWTHEADVQFDQGPDANVPQHRITVQPGPLGIHAGHTKYLRFLDAHVNGVPARQNAGQIISRYGLHDSPEFGQPVEIAVHDPAHIAPIVEQIQSSQGAVATPRMKELGHKIQSGQLPPPPGIDPSSIAPIQQPAEVPVTASIHTSGPALAIGGEALLGGGAAEAAGGAAAAGGGEAAGGGLLSGGLGSIAPSLMKGALFRQGENMIGGGGSSSPSQAPTGEGGGSGPPELSQLAAILMADYETPSSNKDVGTKHDDPEDVDQKEFNDKESDPNPKNPNLEDSGLSGEDEVREHAGFAPDSPGIERLGLLLPLVLHYFHSAESGGDDPMIRGLHEVLEAENPGYLDNVTPEDEQKAKHFIDQLGSHQHDKKQGKVALVPPMQNGYVDPVFEQQQNEQMQGQMPVAIPTPPGGAQQQGHCPNCGGVLTADGSCPQCGAKRNPMGGTTMPGQVPMSGGPSMPAQINAHFDILAALVDSANHQGPVTPEQIAAVQQLLIKQHRVHEVPNVPLNPGEYAKEMAEIQQNPNVAPQVPEGEQTSPPAPAMGGAPGGMPMPGMGGAEPGGAPMTPLAHLAADNVAGRCPNCNSASTGMLMDEEGHQHCHSCGNIWKNKDAFTDKSVNKETRWITAAPGEITPDQTQNPSNANDAERHHRVDVENNQDSSLTWKDTEGNPLEAGREYEMHSESYDVPDIIRVERVKPDGLDVKILGTFANDPNALAADTTITREEAQLERFTFAPAAENADQRGEAPPGSQTPGDQQIPPSGQTTDEVANSQQMSSSVQKHAPMSEHDAYFGGAGGAEKALSAMKKEYGDEKGENVFYALLNKRKKSMVTESDIRKAEMLAAQAQGTGNVVHSLNEIPEPEIDDHCPKCGNRTIQSSMSSPTKTMHECFRCDNVWETNDEMPDYDGSATSRSWVYESSIGGDDFFEGMERARAMRDAGQMQTRNIADVAAKDTRQQQISEYLSSQASERQERIAGKKFTPQEQRALIDEDGNARNSDLLQLGGTHYRTRSDFTGKANGENVPAGHLAFGI